MKINKWGWALIVYFIVAGLVFLAIEVKPSGTPAPRLGPVIGPITLPRANLPHNNVYAYRYGKYCGKGVYTSSGDKYTFGCHIAVRVIPKATPTPKPIIVSGCNNNDDRGCALAALSLLNKERSLHGYNPLEIDWNMSLGTGTCIGSKGHSLHMASTNTLAHDQFPSDICGSYSSAGENIGYGYGNEWDAFKQVNDIMLGEPWTPGCNDNHHCNIDYPGYRTVGIGFAQASDGAWFVSEDFIN